MQDLNNYKAIVIGTSAGGLSALSFMLEELPAAYALPLVIVQHRVKDHRQLLEEILQSKCNLVVKQADEKEPIQPGTVYLAPPDYHLLVERDFTLSLSGEPPVCFSRPSIDVLFETAAYVYRHTLVAILLTGANSDGAAGIVAVNRQGGLTIAQEPTEAEFPFMPAAAIGTNSVQHVLTLKGIKNFLLTGSLI